MSLTEPDPKFVISIYWTRDPRAKHWKNPSDWRPMKHKRFPSPETLQAWNTNRTKWNTFANMKVKPLKQQEGFLTTGSE